MKRIFSLILAMMVFVLPIIADGSNDKSNNEPITLILHPTLPEPHPIVHRSPMRICVDAYYDAWTKTITIQYDGEATGEVLLYRNGELVDTSTEINTSFLLSSSGLYTIAISTEYWTAEGLIEI